MNNKKEVLENQENNKSAEIEALFKKVEKIPYGEIFVSIFKENTITESRKLVVESRWSPDKKIMGTIQKETSLLPPTMVLSVGPAGHFFGVEDDIFRKNGVELEIFDNLLDANNNRNPSIKFYTYEGGCIGCRINCKLPLRPFDDTGESNRSRFFIKIISEVSSKVLRAARGGGDAGGVGSRPHF